MLDYSILNYCALEKPKAEKATSQFWLLSRQLKASLKCITQCTLDISEGILPSYKGLNTTSTYLIRLFVSLRVQPSF